MAKAESLGVKKLPPERVDCGARVRIRHSLITTLAVRFVAHDRVFQPCQVNSDLVRAPRLDLYVEQGESLITLPDAVKRKRRARATHNGHARPRGRVTPYGLVYPPAVLRDEAVDERDVRFENLARPKLIRKILMHVFGFRDDD